VSTKPHAKLQEHRRYVCGVLTQLKAPGAFLLKEIRAGRVSFFLEPGTVAVHPERAAEAIRSGSLVARDRDLFNQPMTWISIFRQLNSSGSDHPHEKAGRVGPAPRPHPKPSRR
jgi:hypothetical protein